MNCYFFKEKGILYLYGELNEQEMKRFRQHLESCPFCREEVLKLKETINIFKEKRMNKPDSGVVENILLTTKEKGFLKPGIFSFNYKSPIFTFCSVAAVVVIGFLFFYQKDFGLLSERMSWQFEDEIEIVRKEVDEELVFFDEEINDYSASFFNREMEEIKTEVDELGLEMNEV